VVLALAEMGRGDDAWRCFQMLNPVNHALDKPASDIYRVEPYVVAADIYGEGQLAGRGGWSWYTGSAGWMYRVAIEGLLGIRVANGHLYVKPALPSHWDGFTAELHLSDTKYLISVSKLADASGYAVTVNDRAIADPGEGYAIGQ
jgi:cyclic beta-1,2-glucan synthetase